MTLNDIVVIGAKTNNLKNVDVKIPRNKFTVITGVSGSGKSSLAFDTIYAEGYRRYVESLSVEARQLLEQMPKASVDSIKGLVPAIAISQENRNRNPRSTVGTVTEIYDFMKLLYARIGHKDETIVKNIEPNYFSFNSPYGACDICEGRGFTLTINPQLIIDKTKSLNQGAVLPWQGQKTTFYERILEKLRLEYNINADIPTEKLPESFIHMLLYGIPEKKFAVRYKNYAGKYRSRNVEFTGVIRDIETRLKETPSQSLKDALKNYMTEETCYSCHGYRLKPESLSIKINNHHIGEISQKSLDDAYLFFMALPNVLNEVEQRVSQVIVTEIQKRLKFLTEIGLQYLTLDRPVTTLSGGEMQRIRLATQLGSDLSGVLYVLDEPSIGLHSRDNKRLINSLKQLCSIDNTVIVVEHDKEIIEEADYIIDVGPGAGEQGGQILAIGTPSEIELNPNSITGHYLSGKKSITRSGNIRETQEFLTLFGCKKNNLKNITVTIPLNVFVAVTGVSGSGKSTLVNEVLYKALKKKLNGANNILVNYDGIEGNESIDKVEKVSQSPIGRSPRSNPATYTGTFDDIRELFANTKDARERGLNKSSFSFNVSGGRCEECSGDGVLKFDMDFLSDVYVTCPRCEGKRYNGEILEVLYKGKSISDVLKMTVSEALELFKDAKKIKEKLRIMEDVGLGYIRLGQSSMSLSGGEAQRIKLATHLFQRGTGKTMFILDEPTTGLHFADIDRLLRVLQRIVDNGNTVVVIEHNLDVIASADFVIDMGPDGGDKGGVVLASGKPSDISENPQSVTGRFLKMNLS